MVDYSIIIIYKIVTKNETRKDNNYYFSDFSIFILV
jgi:hypothetical protein